ncbi:PepSY domain-containing protein [Peribacillus loiseleuriae]|uniref:PepSY domain-containing protein n=1 Tax=Peribacillus loiseleuriae TaxID=1679170 RepID=UPI003D033CD8
MNVLKILIKGALIAVGLGAHTMMDTQPVTKPTHAPSQTINELEAKMIALDTSKGGLVTNTQAIEVHGNKKYEISILHQDTEYNVNIDASTGKILKFDQGSKVWNIDN